MSIDYTALGRDPAGTIFDKSRSNDYEPTDPGTVVSNRLAKALKDFEDGGEGGGRIFIFRLDGDDVALTPRYGISPIIYANGRSTNVYTREQFPAVVKALCEDFEGGAFDDQLTPLHDKACVRMAALRAKAKA